MNDFADLEELLSTVLPAGHPAGDEFASFEKFCDRVEAILAVASLDDEDLGAAFDAWSTDISPEVFASGRQRSG